MSRYPMLDWLDAQERAGFIAKAEAGLPLTPEECVRLGLAPCDSLVLMPVEESSDAQLAAVFAGDPAALKDIVRKPNESKVRERRYGRTSDSGAKRAIPVLAAHTDRYTTRANLPGQ